MQSKPDYLDQLLDLAKEKTGSDYATAKQIGSSRSALSDWRKGRKTCPVGDVALLAEIAGLDAEAWTARAVIASYGNTPKGMKIATALKKAFRATGAATALSGLLALVIVCSAGMAPRPALANSYDV